MGGGTTLHAADYLILDALRRSALSTTELSRRLQISRSAAENRLKRFEELGLIIKRAPDRRWVAKVVFRVETTQETLEAETGKAPVLPDPALQTRKVPETASEAAQEAREQAPIAPPDPESIPQPERVYKAHKPVVAVSPKALELSKKFNLPANLAREGGELSFTKLDACKDCGGVTPFRYGSNPICPRCARKGH